MQPEPAPRRVLTADFVYSRMTAILLRSAGVVQSGAVTLSPSSCHNLRIAAVLFATSRRRPSRPTRPDFRVGHRNWASVLQASMDCLPASPGLAPRAIE
jgi:hypothetical protein